MTEFEIIVTEAAYKGNIGMMEMFKFYQVATEQQKILMKKLIAQGNQEQAWKLLQQVTGVNLKEQNNDLTDNTEKKFDKILLNLCQMIVYKQRQNPDHYGMVAACVLDSSGNEISAVNFRHKGKRIHGELAAILKYKTEVGPLTDECIIITTLSPCSKIMNGRYGSSCTDVINNSPVKFVYCGYSDPTQDDSDAYANKNFDVEITNNKKIQNLCKKIADTFLKESLTEVNSNTHSGSNGPGLPQFREWALTELKKIKTKFDSIYILGSWYGNLSLMIADDDDIGYDRIFNVELDKEALKTGNEIAKKLGYDFIESMHKDVNELDYRMIGSDGLVINQSCVDIENDQWFENIPSGTMVLLTARNNNPNAVNQFTSLTDMIDRYPLKKVLFAGKKQFEDPETEYQGFMLIGIK